MTLRGRRLEIGLIILVSIVAVFATSCTTQVTAAQTAQVYYDLGNAYAQLGEQDKATAAYLNALKLDSSLLQASYNLARAYIEAGSYQKAISLLNSLLSKDPNNLIVLDTLGFAYYRKGDTERALGYYNRVLDLAPTNENALYNKGTILSDQGNSQGAIASFSKLYEINSEPGLLLLLGKLEIADGKTEEGIHYLEAYRTSKPDDFDGLKALADAYRSDKLYDKALNAYNAALNVKPGNSDVLFSKAEILLTAIQDEANGMKALKAALDAGFNNRKSLDALLSNQDLVGKHEVETLLKSKDLLPQTQTTGAGTPSSTH